MYALRTCEPFFREACRILGYAIHVEKARKQYFRNLDCIYFRISCGSHPPGSRGLTVRGNCPGMLCWHTYRDVYRLAFKLGAEYLVTCITEIELKTRVYHADTFEEDYQKTAGFRFEGAAMLYRHECNCERGF